MYSPPPGYEDLLSDAENHQPLGLLAPLDIPELGTVQALKPCPCGVAWLAMSSNPKASPAERTDHLVRFVNEHLAEGELERLYFDMMLESGPRDSVERVARSLATWGTARPYVAVATLSVMTGYHWRTLRHKLLSAGVTDPLAQLTSLHALLDFTEATIVENLSHGENARQEYRSLNARLYCPTELNGDGYDPVPAGFSDDEVEDSFDAFARAAR